MLSPLKATFGESFLNTGHQNAGDQGHSFTGFYLKPFLLALLVTILMSVAIGYIFITLAERFFVNEIPVVKTTQLATQVAKQQNKLTGFITGITQQYGSSAITLSGAYTSVRLSGNTMYRLQRQSTYQELATTSETICQEIARQLDAKGIEYEVFKNNSAPVLIGPGEWIIGWGGILFLPQATSSFSLAHNAE